MRLLTIIVAIAVVALWYLSLFYIAAPHEIHNMLAGGFGMTHAQHQILGVFLFMVSLVIITLWALTSKDTSEAEASTQVPPQKQTGT